VLTNDLFPDLDRERAERLRGALARAWVAMTGVQPRAVADDLDQLRRWFGPVPPKVVRERLESMAPLPPDLRWLPERHPTLVIAVGDAGVVTPEGRCVLAELTAAPDRREAPERELAEAYRAWARQRVLDAAERRNGGARPLNPVAVAAAAVLLVHGADAEQRALRIPRMRSEPIAEALRAPLIAFVSALRGRPYAFRQDFEAHPIREAKDCIGTALHRERRPAEWVLWIDPPHAATLHLLFDETLRHRTGSRERAAPAFRALADAYAERTAPALGRDARGAKASAAAFKRRLAAHDGLSKPGSGA